MRNAELYKGISPDKQAEYEKWLIDKYGGDMPSQIAASRKKCADLSPEEVAQIQQELHDVEQGLADGLRNGVAADSAALDPLVARHRDWVGSMWDRPCPPEAYVGLADLYLSHPDFITRYEQIEAGFAQYIATAMKAHARRLAT